MKSFHENHEIIEIIQIQSVTSNLHKLHLTYIKYRNKEQETFLLRHETHASLTAA